MILPGTTSASSAPASLLASDGIVAQTAAAPILLDHSMAHLLLAAVPHGWAPAPAVERWSSQRPQVVSVYGYPGICFMGELGCDTPAAAVARARELAVAIDEANGERAAVPALHLIVAVAQPNPGPSGTYLAWMDEDTIHEWVELARREEVLLFLDVQIGWSDLSAGVRYLRPFLEEPFVHLALDPEFATRPKQLPPGEAIGTLDAVEVNLVQGMLADIVRTRALPPKMLVLHQFKPGMLTNKSSYVDYPEIDLTIDMDGFGGPEAKISGYDAYARVDSELAAFKLFFHWDVPVITPAQLQALPHPPDYVIYQ